MVMLKALQECKGKDGVCLKTANFTRSTATGVEQARSQAGGGGRSYGIPQLQQ